MNRRAFLRRLPVVSATTATASAGLVASGCASVPYVVGRDERGRVIVPLATLESGVDALVESAATPAPVYVRRAEDGSYVALLLRCTHRGCQPEPATDRLECPCHGSEYNFSGEVLKGPAPRPLTRYRTRTEGQNLIIELEQTP